MTEARHFRFFEIWQERRILWLDDEGGVEKKCTNSSLFVAVGANFFSTPPWWRQCRRRRSAVCQYASFLLKVARTSCAAQPERKPKWRPFSMETATRSDSLAARDRHVEEHKMDWHRRRNQNLWKVWALEVLTGRPWLPSLEGRFSVDISLCRYAIASTWKAETAS